MDYQSPETNRISSGDRGGGNVSPPRLPRTGHAKKDVVYEESSSQSTLGDTEGEQEASIGVCDEKGDTIDPSKCFQMRNECLRIRKWLDSIRFRQLQLLMEYAGFAADDEWDRADELETEIEALGDQRSFIKQLIFD